MAEATRSRYRELFYPAGQPAWAAPEIFRINKLPARASFRRYSGVRAAGVGGSGERVISLDGEWGFEWFPKPEAALAALERGERAEVGLEVPGSWQVQGLAHPERVWDRPHYTNVRMPVAGMEPPMPPEANPTGVYRRALDIPAGWDGQRVVLQFGGADNTLLVFVDGQPVGLSKDSRLPAEFEVTGLVQPGQRHVLEAVVIKFSDSTYIEDQDHWWLSGLHRSVKVEARPEVHVADIQAEARLLEDNRRGLLHVVIQLGGAAAAEGAEVELRLHEGSRSLLKKPLRSVCRAVSRGGMEVLRGAVEFTHRFPRVKPWSAEQPQLYRMGVVVRRAGRVVEATEVMIGFRRVEIRDRQLLINGEPVMIHGVNRHDHHPGRGKALRAEDMELDVLMMKRHNVNAVRCSHYPNDPYFLDLCDRHGLYVIDEANIEAHAFYHECCRDPRYLGAFVDRVSGMVRRDRNHPCVIAWSLGNESGYGPNHDAAAGWVRSMDPGRPLHYEGALCRGWEKEKSRATDIICPMYASIEQITGWAKDPKHRDDPRPLILCEYSHAMGNSNGCLADYYRAFESTPGLQGGFIWEWIDHGLEQPLPGGGQRWAYGGDFGDEPNDANFVCDGLVWPDRTPHPALKEFQYLARPVALEGVDARNKSVRLRNKRHFTGLEDLAGSWQIVVEGEVMERGALPRLKARPGQTETIRVPWKTRFTGAAWLQVHFRLRRATSWASAGHLVAWDELPLPEVSRTTARCRSLNEGMPWEVKSSTGRWSAQHGEQRIEVCTGTTENFCWKLGDLTVLAGAPALQIWRAPTDNDGIKLEMARQEPNEWTRLKPLWRWQQSGLDRLVLRPARVGLRGARWPVLVISQDAELPSGKNAARLNLTIGLRPGGVVEAVAEIRLAPGVRDIPRAGLRLVLPQGWEHFRWFGRGPWENYPDRCAAALHGIYENTVRGEFVPYIMPQENGLKTGVRWVELSHFNGAVFRVESKAPMAASALHATAEGMSAATHLEELAPVAETYLSLDAAHRGVGTMSCGPDTLETYRLMAGCYQLELRMSVRA